MGAVKGSIMAKIRRLQTPASGSRLYGTKQVAEILRIPEWRVKNFAEGVQYRIPPSIRVGTGRGSRRLYTEEDVFRIALADHLVQSGFTAEEVGCGVREVPESAFKHDYVLESFAPISLPLGQMPILIRVACTSPVWQFTKARVASKWAKDALGFRKQPLPPRGVFVLNIAELVYRVRTRLDEYHEEQAQKEKQPGKSGRKEGRENGNL